VKTTGIGRIVLWRGGSLWIGRAGEPTDFHSHHAIQITLSLSDGVVRFRRPDANWNAYRAAIIAAHRSHAFEARGEYVAMIFVEPESREGRALQQICRDEPISSFAYEMLELELAALTTSYNRAAQDSELIAHAHSVITKLAAMSTVPPLPLDKRIEQALKLLRERIAVTVPLAEMADAACLSPDRFRHLFIEQTGMRFRPYVLWLRIEIALTALASGKTLTEASHAGGFADSAHFSRTFKRMFGIAPSSFQRE